MMRCLIVDDEPLAIRVLRHLLADVPDVTVAATTTRPFEAPGLIRDEAIDLVFLDIEMPGLSGLDVVRSMADPPDVIFTTAHREHAVEGFELDAVDYLMKPIALPRLLRALEKVRARRATTGLDGAPAGTHAVIHVRSDRRVVAVPTADIRCVEALGDYVVIHRTAGRLTTRTTLSDMADELSGHGFLRVHRSHVVNPAFVSAWSTDALQVGDRSVPVGRTYRAAVAARMRELSRGG